MPNTIIFRATPLPPSYTSSFLLYDLTQLQDGPDSGPLSITNLTFTPSLTSPNSLTALFGLPKPLPSIFHSLLLGSKKKITYFHEDIEIHIDCHFFGLTQLYANPEGESIQADIIALHGLDGHPYGSFIGRNNLERMWLRDLFPGDFPKCRTIIYGYDAKLRQPLGAAGGDGREKMVEFVEGLVEGLKMARRTEEEKKRPVVWIAHSFGGVVLAQVLQRIHEMAEREDKSLLTLTYGILLFGTPHRGMITDAMEQLLTQQSFAPSPLLKHISQSSSTLQEPLDNFIDLCETYKWRLKSFYETQKTQTITIKPDGKWVRDGPFLPAVPKYSAVLKLPGSREEPISLSKDHSDMVKFTTRNDHAYQIVVMEMENLIEGIERRRKRLGKGEGGRMSSRGSSVSTLVEDKEGLGKGALAGHPNEVLMTHEVKREMVEPVCVRKDVVGAFHKVVTNQNENRDSVAMTRSGGIPFRWIALFRIAFFRIALFLAEAFSW